MVRTYLGSFARPAFAAFCAICFTRSFYFLSLCFCLSNLVLILLEEPEVSAELE